MSTNSSCNISATTRSAIRNLYIATYIVIPPFYLIVGNALCLAAFLFFKRQVKKNQAYGYQLAACSFKLIEMYTFTCCSILQDLAGWGPVSGWSYFRSSYGLMWYTSRIGYALPGMAINQFMIFPSAIAVDRAFALTMPLTYRNINHTKHLVVACTLTLLVSISVGIDFAFDFDVVEADGGEYSLGYGAANAQSWKRIMASVKSGVRYSALTVMIISTVVFVYQYRKRNKVKPGNSLVRQKDSKGDERALVVLSCVQCSMICVFMASSAVLVTTRTYLPQFYACLGSLVQYSFPLVIQSCGIADYVILLMYNKTFRQMIMRKFKKGPNPVATTSAVRNL